ncbi:transmembrane protein 60 [Anabrus simplex]|uniref:transmembrane protein 60 n=1 Tax=Anabrus simplex TaxID=316456 RepID=UPI0034DD6BB6
MAVLHRALFTWFVLLVFLILLVLRLDTRTQWNWFIVFIPLWVYDTILLIYVLFHMISHCKNGHDRLWSSVHRKIWYISAIVLKMTTQITLCLKLQYPAWEMSIYYVMAPLWLLLPALLTDVFITLVKRDSRY